MTAPDPLGGAMVPVPKPDGGAAVPRAALERVLARAAELQQAAVAPDGQETVPEAVLVTHAGVIRVLVAPLLEVAADAARRARLVASLRSMSEAVIAYKHLASARERVLAAWG